MIGADVVLMLSVAPEWVGVEEDSYFNCEYPVTFHTERFLTYTRAQAFHLPAGDLGVETDRHRKVLKIVNPSLRDAGLVEGDTLFKVDGITFDPTGTSAKLNSWRMNALPHEPVDLVWIRPGTGRLEGQALVMKNDASYLDQPDLVQWAAGETKPRRGARRAKRMKGF